MATAVLFGERRRFYDPAGALETLCNATSLSSNNFTGFTSTQAHHDYTNDGLLAFGAKFTKAGCISAQNLALSKIAYEDPKLHR